MEMICIDNTDLNLTIGKTYPVLVLKNGMELESEVVNEVMLQDDNNDIITTLIDRFENAEKNLNIDYNKLLDDWGEKLLTKSDALVSKEEEEEVGSPKWQRYRSYGDGLRMALAMLNRMEKVRLTQKNSMPKYVLTVTPTAAKRDLTVGDKTYTETYKVVEANDEKDLLLINNKMENQVPDSYKENHNFATDILCIDTIFLYYMVAAMNELNEHLAKLNQATKR